LQERRWWPEALATFGVDPGKLATLHPPGSPCGRTTAAATRHLGLPAGIPFAVGGLDHHVAALGAGMDLFADASISTGTVLAAICVVDRVVPMPNCFHGPHLAAGRYYRLAFDEAGAGQLDQFQRQFAPERSLDELIAEAARLPPASRPGKIRDRAAAMRALLEQIARTQRSLVATVAGEQTIRCISATGGGARSAAWLAIKADVLGLPIVTPACLERACLGAAAFAAVAAGMHATATDALRAMVRPDRRFEPDPVRSAAYRERDRLNS
jgi:sugar (pentulose or hexulose) kinase